MTSAFPISVAAGTRLIDKLKALWGAWRTERAQRLIIRAIGLDAFVLARAGLIPLTADELTWVAARAGVIDHEAISARPRPDELTAQGLLALREKLTRALTLGPARK